MPTIKPKSQSYKGFTLVELIVSLGLFALVMLVATGAYYNLISLDRRARATNQVVNSLSFAVDTMVRGIRTGSNFQCLSGSRDAFGNSNDGSCNSFSYSDVVLNTTITYYLKADGTIGRCEGSPCTDLTASSLTDSGINIQKLAFYVRGVGTGNGNVPVRSQQPSVVIILGGTMPAGSAGQTAPFSIQQSATQRIIDF